VLIIIDTYSLTNNWGETIHAHQALCHCCITFLGRALTMMSTTNMAEYVFGIEYSAPIVKLGTVS
jgi:hypothetical protein